MKKLKVILIGVGNRGKTYSNIMADLPEKYEVVAVAEAIDSRRNDVKEKHNIPDNMCFSDWKELLDLGKIADLCVIATMDKEHYEPVLKACELKYDVLLEKPVSIIPSECKEIALCAEKNNVKVVVCTVLRYSPLFMTLKNIIDEGKIGDIVSINHEECVGNIHQSHSFVRGNWGNEGRSSCMLLQKSCHDTDILQWLIGKKCKKVQSFGSRIFFREENAPEGSPEYCIEGCPHADKCPYNAVELYLGKDAPGWFKTTATREMNPTDEMVEHAIRTTQYGKCIFKCDNDVVDHQTVNMLFEDDVTVTFTMNGFNKGGRFIHIMGTKGEIRASTEDNEPIKIFDFLTRETTEIPMSGRDGILGGHFGGDTGIINALYDYLTGTYTGKSVPEIRESTDNHLIVFAAEKSRKENTVVDFDEYYNSLK